MQEDEKKFMGHLYFVRHGQTIWNVEGKICGATDIALTELGHEQAIATGKKILEEHIYADEILYSPLMRAADTAKHISEVTGIPARVEQRLKEQNFGRWESTPRNGAEFQVAKQSFVCSYEGGESMLRLAQRIYNLLDEIKAQSGLSKGRRFTTVLIGSLTRFFQTSVRAGQHGSRWQKTERYD